ncbi:VanZ family protein, partial [Candidatus Saccharibacteria bacterium]|nr:VanZ family protein [Candidatus Saccharibacteria bacterium]
NTTLVKISKPQTTKTVAKKITLDLIKYSLFMSILLSFLYACTDEIHQIFVPGRSAQFRDVLIDTLGASFGTLIAYLIIKLITKIKEHSKI